MNKTIEDLIKQAANIIKKAESIVLTFHEQPDGDAFGSVLSLMHFLNTTDKKICATWGEEIKIPSQYQWMPGIDQIVEFEKCIDKAELLISLDCANEHRLGLVEKLLPRFKEVINIDHHMDNSFFGTINIIDLDASATCEIVYNLLKQLNARITPDIANCLYTGIVTDTGRFQYSNTNANTMRIAADLIDFGAETNKIFRNVYENIAFAGLKLLARILDRATLVKESKFVYSYVNLKDLDECGVSMADTEMFIDYLRMAKEAGAAAIFKETPDGKLRVSLRSKGYIDVGSIARERGGGGHTNASGATLETTVEEAVEWISSRLKEQISVLMKENKI